jgi:Xaa-Pro aminopeptidase
MKYTPLPKSLFEKNRKRYVSQLLPNSVAFFLSNDEMPRSGDQHHVFKQNADLYYLTGIDQEQTILVLAPNHPLAEYRELLFIRKTNEHIAVWEGHKYTKEEARQASGITQVYWMDDFQNMLALLMHHSKHVYINYNENDRFSNEVPYADVRFAEKLKSKYGAHHYERSAPIMARLRAIKQEEEIAPLKTAIDITAAAFNNVMKTVKPGITEYEIEAQITFDFLKRRATGHAYMPIIAAGGNSCVLHYTANNQVCKDGDIMLLDFGAEYANYAADLTRVVPINGKFTPRQKAVYNAVLHVMKEAQKMLVVGNTIPQYHEAVGKIMEEELIKLGLLNADEVAQQDPRAPLYKKYFMHGTSHFLGLDVHDIGNRYEPMQAGMVFTCEPGIYIPAEGIGIRLENDILITEQGNVDLMAHIPIAAEEIESIMASQMINAS